MADCYIGLFSSWAEIKRQGLEPLLCGELSDKQPGDPVEEIKKYEDDLNRYHIEATSDTPSTKLLELTNRVNALSHQILAWRPKQSTSEDVRSRRTQLYDCSRTLAQSLEATGDSQWNHTLMLLYDSAQTLSAHRAALTNDDPCPHTPSSCHVL